MKETFKKLIQLTTILGVIFAIGFYLLNKGLLTVDDTTYKEVFHNFSTCLNWIQDFYQLWSGRITLTILIHIFTNLPIQVFKVANTLIFMIVIGLSYKSIVTLKDDWNKNLKNTLLIVLFCSIFFISVPVINSGCLWLAGAMNYFWPVAGMLISMFPFVSELKGKSIRPQYYIIFILSNFLAGFAEQTGAILVAFGMITILWQKLEKKKINKLLILHYIVIVVFTFINLLAPGNHIRSYAEELKWYPSYSMLSVSDKLIQGYLQVTNHLINDTTLLFSFIALLSSFSILTNKEMRKINKVIALLPILYVCAKVVSWNQLFGGILLQFDADDFMNDTFFSFKKFSIDVLYRPRILLQLVSSSLILGIITAQLIYSFKTKKTGLIIAILYCASLCSGLALSFSPSIYASGNRIYMATDFLLVIIHSFLWIELFQKLFEKQKYLWKILLFVLAVLGILCYTHLYRNGIQNIIY